MSEDKKVNKFKALAEKVLLETKESRIELDKLDTQLYKEDLTSESSLEMARKAAGHGNFILKKYVKLKSLMLNEKNNKYSILKLEADTSGSKFVSAPADRAASMCVNDLRIVRDILEAYVTSANNVVSVCRMHRIERQSDAAISANL